MQEKWKNVRQAAEEGRYEDIPEDVRFLQYKAVEHHRLVGKKRCISGRGYAWWLPAVQIVKLD